MSLPVSDMADIPCGLCKVSIWPTCQDQYKHISHLKECFKEHEIRSNASSELINCLLAISCAEFSRICENQSMEKSIVIECLRCIRNLCAQCPHNQLVILSNQDYVASLKRILEIHAEDELLSTALFQLIWNIANSSADIKKIVWKNFHLSLIDCIIGKHQSPAIIAKMIFSTTSSDVEEEINTVVEHTDFIMFFTTLLNYISSDEPNALSCIQSLLAYTNCLTYVWDFMSINEKQLVSEIVSSIIENGMNISANNISVITSSFKQSCNNFVKTVSENAPMEGLVSLVDLTQMLSDLSTQEKFNVLLQRDLELFIDVTLLLKTVHLSGKKGNPLFNQKKNIEVFEKQMKGDTSLMNDPTYGFKKDLMRLIANLLYKCPENQNMLRETECVSLILDCCSVDAKNPFIIQWTILAIRNMMEGNLENQEILSSLSAKGQIDISSLEAAGIKINEPDNV